MVITTVVLFRPVLRSVSTLHLRILSPQCWRVILDTISTTVTYHAHCLILVMLAPDSEERNSSSGAVPVTKQIVLLFGLLVGGALTHHRQLFSSKSIRTSSSADQQPSFR
jgi:hypothetical protein